MILIPTIIHSSTVLANHFRYRHTINMYQHTIIFSIFCLVFLCYFLVCQNCILHKNTPNPLIVFGFTDVELKFFQIAFMFTSHETLADYIHFWVSFLEVCAEEDVEFKPKFILSDASSQHNSQFSISTNRSRERSNGLKHLYCFSSS